MDTQQDAAIPEEIARRNMDPNDPTGKLKLPKRVKNGATAEPNQAELYSQGCCDDL